MQLIGLTAAHGAAYADYLREYAEAGESMVPGAAGSTEIAFSDYLRVLEIKSDPRRCPVGWTPSVLWFLEDDGRLLGAIDMRLALNDRLLQFAGHIGYGVRPSERGKGYATYMLRHVLDILRSWRIGRVLVTCREGNAASARVIEKCGGVPEDIRDGEGGLYRRYWIDTGVEGSAVWDGKDLLDDGALQQLASLAMYRPTPGKIASRIGMWRADPGVRVFALRHAGRWESLLVVADRGKGSYAIWAAATDPAVRRQGKARTLVEHALGRLPVRSLSAETDGDALSFYQRCGFAIRPLGEIDAGTARFACRYTPENGYVGE